jgi:FlaA1/EpsC-like NDP-sugar epimerase
MHAKQWRQRAPGRQPFRRAASLRSRTALRCEAAKRIAVLGGTGRVGSSTVSSLLQDPEYEVVVASRSRASYESAVKLRPELAKTQFQACDIADPQSVKVGSEGCSRWSQPA